MEARRVERGTIQPQIGELMYERYSCYDSGTRHDAGSAAICEGVYSMTKDQLHEQLMREAEVYCPHCTPEHRKMAVDLVEDVLSLSEEQRKRFLKFLRLSERAKALGLDVDVDKATNLYFIKDVATNTVIVPPPMNLETVRAWLDDYEQQAAEE